jgi:hypothetical protein
MTAHASRRSVFATGAWCPCGRPIRWCCGSGWRVVNGRALYPECCCCKVERLAAETARVGGEGGVSISTGLSCSVNGCQRDYRARGYCGAHYARLHRTGSPHGKHRPMPEGCSCVCCVFWRTGDRPAYGKPKPGPKACALCTFVPAISRQLCSAHYQAWRRLKRGQGTYSLSAEDAARLLELAS